MTKLFTACSFLFCLSIGADAQSFNPELFNDMKWRMIGPYRGGRTVGAIGVPQQPNVFYIGVNNGGVWKTTDYGRTWKPILRGRGSHRRLQVAAMTFNRVTLLPGTWARARIILG